MTETEYDKILEAAVSAGVILLRSGAEVHRVEDTVIRICKAYGMDVTHTTYALTNSMMISYDVPEENIHLSRIIQVPIDRMRLNEVIRVNQISRDIAKGNYTPDEAVQKIREVENEKDTPFIVRLLAAAVASFFFGIIFNGSVPESLIAGIAGAAAFFASAYLCAKSPKILSNAVGGAVLALFAVLIPLLFRNFGGTLSSEKIMLGAMMPLVPGLAFTNSFRDFANSDYLSGTVRLLDALLVCVSMAAGAAVTYRLITLIGGIAL